MKGEGEREKHGEQFELILHSASVCRCRDLTHGNYTTPVRHIRSTILCLSHSNIDGVCVYLGPCELIRHGGVMMMSHS